MQENIVSLKSLQEQQIKRKDVLDHLKWWMSLYRTSIPIQNPFQIGLYTLQSKAGREPGKLSGARDSSKQLPKILGSSPVGGPSTTMKISTERQYGLTKKTHYYLPGVPWSWVADRCWILGWVPAHKMGGRKEVKCPQFHTNRQWLFYEQFSYLSTLSFILSSCLGTNCYLPAEEPGPLSSHELSIFLVFC